MKIGILGTGSVGKTIGSALVKRGHPVMLGGRVPGSAQALAWKEKAGSKGEEGSYAQAAAFGDLLFICCNGAFVLDVVRSLPKSHFEGKIIVDVTNPLQFSAEAPPRILPAFQTVSLGEQLQAALPGAYVVKALNTVSYKVMADARLVNNGDHNLYLCGDNEAAKTKVKALLADNFYWKRENLIDLGDIRAAHCLEAIVPFWVLVMNRQQTPVFNFKIVQ